MAKLEHCNIRSFDLAATIAFYRDVVGLTTDPTARATWLFDETGTAVIHLIAVDRTDPEGEAADARRRLGEMAGSLDLATWQGGGAIDHVAFQCHDFAAMTAKLDALGYPFHVHVIEAMQLRQIFVNDPSGVTLELNFRG